IQRPALCDDDNFAQLPTGYVVSREVRKAARAASITRDDTLMVSGLNILVESVRSGHVNEGGNGRGVYGEALGQHHYLCQLPARGEVVRTERAVAVARYRAHRRQVAHRVREVVGRVHIREVYGARRRCGSGAWRRVSAALRRLGSYFILAAPTAKGEQRGG